MSDMNLKNRLGLYLSIFFAIRKIRIKLFWIFSAFFVCALIATMIVPRNIISILIISAVVFWYVVENMLMNFYDCWEFEIIHPITDEEKKVKILLRQKLTKQQMYSHKTGDF